MAVGHSLASKRVPKPTNKPNDRTLPAAKKTAVCKQFYIFAFPQLAWDRPDESLRKCQKFRKVLVGKVLVDCIPRTNQSQ